MCILSPQGGGKALSFFPSAAVKSAPKNVSALSPQRRKLFVSLSSAQACSLTMCRALPSGRRRLLPSSLSTLCPYSSPRRRKLLSLPPLKPAPSQCVSPSGRGRPLADSGLRWGLALQGCPKGRQMTVVQTKLPQSMSCMFARVPVVRGQPLRRYVALCFKAEGKERKKGERKKKKKKEKLTRKHISMSSRVLRCTSASLIDAAVSSIRIKLRKSRFCSRRAPQRKVALVFTHPIVQG